MFDQTQDLQLFQTLTRSNGQVIPSRIVNAAMNGDMADARHLPGSARWADIDNGARAGRA